MNSSMVWATLTERGKEGGQGGERRDEGEREKGRGREMERNNHLAICHHAPDPSLLRVP